MVSFENKADEKLGYDEYNVEGIRVFIAKSIQPINGELQIVLKSFLFFKSLAVIGVQLMK